MQRPEHEFACGLALYGFAMVVRTGTPFDGR